MKYNYLKLAKTLKELRIERGYTIKKLSQKSKVKYKEISDIENGLYPNFSFVKLVKICKALETDFDYILTECGIVEELEEKLFYVMIIGKNPKIFAVHDVGKFGAMCKVLDLVMENKLIELDPNKENIAINATEYLMDYYDDFKQAVQEFLSK